MKNSSYWKKRFSELENINNQYAQQTFNKIAPTFDKAQMEIQKEIDRWYGRFAKNNEISIVEARRLLNSNELKELKWDVNKYIKYGEENAINQKWIKELENASAKFHITRLEALKLRTQQAMEVAFGNELAKVYSMMKHLYQECYYHTCFEIQKGFNLGWEIGQIDNKKLDVIINKPWTPDGKNFSTRIWQRKVQMVNELHQELTRTLLQGKSPDEAINRLEKFVSSRIKNSKSAVGRLVMTEQAFISSTAQKDAFTDLDVEEFEIVATLDSHTSDICQEMDGKHFPIKDYQPGVTAPPFHVWCRSVTSPYFDDEFTLDSERVARGEDGKTYYVPSNMTYPEWKEQYISVTPNTDKYRLKYSKEKSHMERKDRPSITARKLLDYDKIYKSINSTLSKKQVVEGKKLIEESYELIKNDMRIKNKPNIIFVGKEEMGSDAIASFDPYNNNIYVSQTLFDGSDITALTKNFYKGEDPRSTILHELCHVIQNERVVELFGISYKKISKNKSKKIKYNKLYWEMVKESVDRYEKQGYTINISDYAFNMYMQKKLYEIEAEYFVKKFLK